MDSNLSSDSHHMSPFFLQEVTALNVSALKHQGALTLNPFPRARVESLGLPLCSEFPRIPGEQSLSGLGLGPPGHASLPPSSFQGQSRHPGLFELAHPQQCHIFCLRVEKGQTLREWAQESVTCRCSVASVPRDSQIKSTLLYQQEKLSFFPLPNSACPLNSTWQCFQEHRAGA